jgi:hypothetical protein
MVILLLINNSNDMPLHLYLYIPDLFYNFISFLFTVLYLKFYMSSLFLTSHHDLMFRFLGSSIRMSAKL